MTRAEPGREGAGSGLYRFGDIELDAVAHTLARAGVAVQVEPKAFAVLLVLLRHAGELVEHEQLLDQVWGHRHVTPGVLTRAVAQLRHALEDDSQQPRYIQTQHALGYRFIGELLPDPVADAVPARGRADARQETAEPAAVEPERPAPDATAAHGHDHDLHFRWNSPWLVAFALVATVIVAWMLIDRSPSSPAPAEASIAVMPFTSLSSDRKDDYFAEGLAEEMRDALAGVKGLKVAASVSPAARVGAADAKALGAKLGVATILDASVRREGDRLRISARLSDTSTGFTIWSHTYDRELAGVFATQSEIAGEVVHSLLGAMPGENQALARRLTPTHDVAAFDSYLQGLQLLGQSADQKAVARFGSALERDAEFARAQAGICRAQLLTFERLRNADAFTQAQRACTRAREMGIAGGEVELAFGDMYRIRGEYAKAIESYTRATNETASKPDALVGLGLVYASRGRTDLAIANFDRALDLRPGDASLHSRIGYQRYLDGHADKAIESYRRAVEISPGNADLWSTLGGLLLTVGSNQEAGLALDRSMRIKPTDAVMSNYGALKLQEGDYAGAAVLFRKALELNSGDFMIWGYLGDALLADPGTSGQSRQAFQRAADMAEGYLSLKPDDAQAVAALGWYRAGLGQHDEARALVARSEALGTEPGEVAMYNAQTLALMGDMAQARRRIEAARRSGIPERRIRSDPFFRNLFSSGQAQPHSITP